MKPMTPDNDNVVQMAEALITAHEDCNKLIGYLRRNRAHDPSWQTNEYRNGLTRTLFESELARLRKTG